MNNVSPQAFVQFATSGRQFSKSYISWMDRLDEISTKTFAFNLTEMTQLTPFDRMKIIEKNYRLINGLQVHFFLLFGSLALSGRLKNIK